MAKYDLWVTFKDFPDFNEFKEEDPEKYYKLEKEIIKTHELDIPIVVFDENFKEYKSHEAKHNDPEFYRKVVHEPYGMFTLTQHNFKTVVNLHNFISSSYTLIDNTRSYHKRYYVGLGIFQSYQSEVKSRFYSCEVSSVIKDFRRLLQHSKIPFPITEINFQKKNFGSYISVKKLLKMHDWSQPSKTYLMYKGHIKIEDIITEYHNKIMDFYRWFRQQEVEAFRNQFWKK